MLFFKRKPKDQLSQTIIFNDEDTDDVLSNDNEFIKTIPKYKKYFLHPLKVFIIMVGHILIHILIVRH